MSIELKDHLEARRRELETDRSHFLQHWRDLQENILVMRGQFMVKERNKEPRFTNIVDNTGTISARVLQNGMQAGITSPARRWFRMLPPDPEMRDWGPVKVWFHDVEKLLFEIFGQSNFYNSLHKLYGEESTFGTGAVAMLPDFDNVIRMQHFTVGSYCIDTNEKDQVDTLYRKVPMTVRQLVRQFGLKHVSNAVRQLWDKSQYSELVTVYHAIEPNEERAPGKRDNQNMPFRSVYWEEGANKEEFLSVSGFKRFRCMVPRWEVMGANTYGTGPGSVALGDIRQLQLEQKRKAQAIDKMVDPPLTGPSSLREEVIDTLPGGTTWHDGIDGPGAGLRPVYEVNPRINELALDIRDVQERIKRAYYEDLFMMLASSDRREITAREIDERHEEKLLGLGPMLERLHNELLDPCIDTAFEYASEAGILPPPPPELQGQEISVEYISVMAQAQKMAGTASMERFVSFAGNLAGTNPDVLDKVDFDQTVDEYGDMMGVPPRMIRSDDQVAALRQQRAQREQQAQAAMEANQMAATASQGAQAAKLLSEADTGNGNLLTQLTGM